MANKKKKSLKPIVLDTAWFIGGLIFGKLIAFLVRDIAFLRWLSFEVAFGVLEPVTIDLALIKFTFGLSVHLNPAVVLFSLLGVVGGRMLKKYMTESKESKEKAKTFADITLRDEDDDQRYDA